MHSAAAAAAPTDILIQAELQNALVNNPERQHTHRKCKQVSFAYVVYALHWSDTVRFCCNVSALIITAKN